LDITGTKYSFSNSVVNKWNILGVDSVVSGDFRAYLSLHCQKQVVKVI